MKEKITLTEDEFLEVSSEVITELIIKRPERMLINNDLCELIATIITKLFHKEEK